MAVFYSGDPVNAVVADVGSYATKIGFAGEDNPRAYFRSNVATLREDEEEELINNEEGREQVTNETKDHRQRQVHGRHRRRAIDQIQYDSLYRPVNGVDDGKWEIANPVNETTGLWYDPQSYNSNSSNNNSNTHHHHHDDVGGSDGADWSDMIPKFLRHGYTTSLGLNDSNNGNNDMMSNNPLMMIERSYNPPPIRQQLLEILMEECQVPATFFGRDATLACYACARTTSTVIDIGYNGTTVSPVYEGYVEQKGIRRSPIGSKAMDILALKHLKEICSSNDIPLKPLYQVRQHPKLVQQQQRRDPFHQLALWAVARECRESGAGQSINTAASKSLQVPSISFQLPDGQTVDVPSQDRFAVAELVIGRPSEEEMESNPREEALKSTKKALQSILLATSQTSHEDEEGRHGTAEDGAYNNDDDDDGNNRGQAHKRRKQEASKYTEATAVGVSSRRTARGGTRTTRAGDEAASTTVAAAAADKKEQQQQRMTKPTKVRFDNRVLQRACVPYLQSHLEQLTSSPIAAMVCDAAFRCEREQQASVLGNVILCGGGACIGPTDQAMTDLLREQIETIIHTHTPGWRVKVLSPSMQERAIGSWLGGSILGSLGTFHEMWITKGEYDEWGSAIVNRKCP